MAVFSFCENLARPMFIIILVYEYKISTEFTKRWMNDDLNCIKFECKSKSFLVKNKQEASLVGRTMPQELMWINNVFWGKFFLKKGKSRGDFTRMIVRSIIIIFVTNCSSWRILSSYLRVLMNATRLGVGLTWSLTCFWDSFISPVT